MWKRFNAHCRPPANWDVFADDGAHGTEYARRHHDNKNVEHFRKEILAKLAQVNQSPDSVVAVTPVQSLSRIGRVARCGSGHLVGHRGAR